MMAHCILPHFNCVTTYISGEFPLLTTSVLEGRFGGVAVVYQGKGAAAVGSCLSSQYKP